MVGVTCPDRLGEVKRNRFGQAFRYAAEQIQVGREGLEAEVEPPGCCVLTFLGDAVCERCLLTALADAMGWVVCAACRPGTATTASTLR